MKRLLDKNINTATYWDKNQTAFDFGLRQIKYRELAGVDYRPRLWSLSLFVEGKL